MNIDEFFLNIKPLRDLSSIGNSIHYEEVPNSWFLVRCEASEDTPLIYRIMSLLASSVLNQAQTRHSIPYYIDGRICFFLVPPTILSNVKAVLHLTVQKTSEKYSIRVTITSIAYSELKLMGGQIFVGRFIFKDDLQQAFFIGGGVNRFQELIAESKRYELNQSLLTIPPVYDGFHSDIANFGVNGKILKISVHVLDTLKQLEHYQQIFSIIARHNVLDSFELKLASDSLEQELDLKGLSGIKRIRQYIEKTFRRFCIKNSIFTKGVSYGSYISAVKEHCITKIIHDSLVLFVDAEVISTQHLLEYLRSLYQQGSLKFEVVPVHMFQVQELLYANELRAYYLESIRG